MTKNSILRMPIIAVAFCMGAVEAGYQLSGTVVDQRGNGYPGIQVRLNSSSAVAVTDAQGRWLLTGTVSTAARSDFGQVSWKGRNLELDLSSPHRFQAEVVDLTGKRVATSIDIRLAPGHRVLPWTERRPWLRTIVRWDAGSGQPLDDGLAVRVAHRTTAEVFDTLVYSENGKSRVAKQMLQGRDSLGMVQFLARADAPWDTLLDPRDGNKYRIVALGGAFGMPIKRQWMAANLRFAAVNGKSNLVTPGIDADGRAYSWATAAALPDSCDTTSCFSQVHEPIQGICPQGWALASAKDWEALWTYVLNQDERLYFGRGVMESIGAIDSRWADVTMPYLPPSEARDFFGLSIPPTTLEYWTSTPWTDQYNEYEGYSQQWQDFRRNARNAVLQRGVAIDEGRKTARLPVRCVRAVP